MQDYLSLVVENSTAERLRDGVNFFPDIGAIADCGCKRMSPLKISICLVIQ
jgi:hypothetical protein